MQHQPRDKIAANRLRQNTISNPAALCKWRLATPCSTPQGGGSNHQQYGFTAGILGGGHAFS
jgi:hypothetical protein